MVNGKLEDKSGKYRDFGFFVKNTLVTLIYDCGINEKRVPLTPGDSKKLLNALEIGGSTFEKIFNKYLMNNDPERGIYTPTLS